MGRASTFGLLSVQWRLVVESMSSSRFFTSRTVSIRQGWDFNRTLFDLRTAIGLVTNGSKIDFIQSAYFLDHDSNRTGSRFQWVVLHPSDGCWLSGDWS